MKGRLHRLYQGETKVDFLGKKKVWFAISAVALVASIASLSTRGLAYGIEFEGGVSIKSPVPDDGSLGDASTQEITAAIVDALDRFEANAQIQVTSTEAGDRSVLVQTKEIADPDEQAEVVSAVARAVDAPLAATDSSRIGSKWGAEITDKAVRALIFFLVTVVAFISWRFEWKMAIAAVAALVHDLLITAGVYSIVGFEVTPSTIIAILTILGYSLYDTVVVFDKLEENTAAFAATGRMTYHDSANLAMNEVFMRSLNTSLATLLPVAALLFVGAGLLGATTLEDLALALFVGLLAGTYSSIFFATPILAMMKEREPRYREARDKARREAARADQPAPVAAPAPAAPAPVTTDGTSERTPSLAGSPARAPGRPSTPVRTRAGSKKAKRRRRR
ncbi:MAG: protein translocase subunit SecF [Actinomycetota bacterium]